MQFPNHKYILMIPTPLVHTSRGTSAVQHIENIHYGAVAVVDRAGKLIASAGDAHFQTFSRSTIKPFQATPFINAGGVAELGLIQQEVALLCSSHSGEAFHIESAASILTKGKSRSEELQCGCHEPLFFGATQQHSPAHAVWSALHNNCSGKHAGFLAWCELHGTRKERYLDDVAPLQQAIRRSLSIWCDVKEEQFAAGIDGCSAPNYALPLSGLALGYARLADKRGGDTAKLLFDAMTEHPEYVSGTGRHDLAFMKTRPKDWVAKIGADGVQLIGIRSAGLGIAVKISDGNQRAVICAAIEVLRQMGQLDDLADTALAPWATPAIVNVSGVQTGQVKPVFTLKMH